MNSILHWRGCYGKQWGSLSVQDAAKHPAKFSRALIYRIARHAKRRGWVGPGDTILDPFGGVALGAIPFLPMGVNWCGVELEPHFVTMAQGNIRMWDRDYGRHAAQWGRAQIYQGDSRYILPLAARAHFDGVVSSPPYGVQGGGRAEGDAAGTGVQANLVALSGGYGRSPGQLGEMRDGGFDAAVSSPPYAATFMGKGHGIDPAKYARESDKGRRPPAIDAAGAGYGAVVSSPPYCDNVAGDDPQKRGGLYRDPRRANDANMTASYGVSPGQLGRMSGVVSSPPYSDSTHGDNRGKYGGLAKDIIRPSDDPAATCYGASPGQMGRQTGDFWESARLIVQACHDLLKPGGVAIWVTKNYCRDRQVVPFSERWLDLNLACGFTLVETIVAHQTDHAGVVQVGLFGEDELLEKRRAGLFRILYESKGGPVVDYETVHVLRK